MGETRVSEYRKAFMAVFTLVGVWVIRGLTSGDWNPVEPEALVGAIGAFLVYYVPNEPPG